MSRTLPVSDLLVPGNAKQSTGHKGSSGEHKTLVKALSIGDSMSLNALIDVLCLADETLWPVLCFGLPGTYKSETGSVLDILVYGYGYGRRLEIIRPVSG